MKILTVRIFKAGNSFSASLPEVDGFCMSDKSIDGLKQRIRESLEFHLEGLYPEERCGWMDEPYEFEYVMEDIASVLGNFEGILNQSSLARVSGINESLMRQYASGIKTPSAKTMAKVRNGLISLAKKLESVNVAL